MKNSEKIKKFFDELHIEENKSDGNFVNWAKSKRKKIKNKSCIVGEEIEALYDKYSEQMKKLQDN